MTDAATVWRHRTGEIRLDRTRVMGILNVTPDSFSDGGRYLDPEQALRHGLEMVEHGADVIDVGGESTRPGSDPVTADEEWRRVGPVIRDLAAKVDVPLSVDTMKPEVMRAAHAALADIDQVVPAAWGSFGETGAVGPEPFRYPIADFYRTDPISRASATMAQCSEPFRGNPERQPRTGTHG